MRISVLLLAFIGADAATGRWLQRAPMSQQSDARGARSESECGDAALSLLSCAMQSHAARAGGAQSPQRLSLTIHIPRAIPDDGGDGRSGAGAAQPPHATPPSAEV